MCMRVRSISVSVNDFDRVVRVSEDYERVCVNVWSIVVRMRNSVCVEGTQRVGWGD